MRKKTLILLIIFMSITFFGLIITQLKFFSDISDLSIKQFDSSVRRSVMQTLRYIEEREALMYLANAMDEDTTSISNTLIIQERIRLQLSDQHGNSSIIQTMNELHKEMMKELERNRTIMDQAVFRWLKDDDKSIADRIDFEEFELVLSNNLSNNGLDLPFAFSITRCNNIVIYNSPQMNQLKEVDKKKKYTYTLFPLEINQQEKGYLNLYFPTRPCYLQKSMSLFTPSFLLMLFVLIIFISTLIIIFNQRRINTIKNDFINNMTHELKTPISSISLASQMLQDNSLIKTPQRLESISNILRDETKRLNLQIEKILQMALFEKKKLPLQFSDIHINTLLYDITKTFAFKVEGVGGKLYTRLDATNDLALIDEVHFTNAIYNLLDNALKYSLNPLLLHVTTRNTKNNKLVIEVEDNGIGISKADRKHIFEKFYRVPTGNLHNIQGFGMGLAYVKKMISEHHGTIQVISEPNIGTKFIITIPTLKNIE